MKCVEELAEGGPFPVSSEGCDVVVVRGILERQDGVVSEGDVGRCAVGSRRRDCSARHSGACVLTKLYKETGDQEMRFCDDEGAVGE